MAEETFVLTAGQLQSPPIDPRTLRIAVIHSTTGRVLSVGTRVGLDGEYEIKFSQDPQGLWQDSGVYQISFVFYSGEGWATGPATASSETQWTVGDVPTELQFEIGELTFPFSEATEAASLLDTGISTHPFGSAIGKISREQLPDLANQIGNLSSQVVGVNTTLGATNANLAAVDSKLATSNIKLADIHSDVKAAGPVTRLELNAKGAAIGTLQAGLVSLGYHVPAAETAAMLYGAGTQDAVKRLQKAGHLKETGTYDEAAHAAYKEADAKKRQGTEARRMQGRVRLQNGGPAAFLSLKLYITGFGGSATSQSVTTDARGYFAFDVPSTTDTTKKTVEIFGVKAGGQEVPLSRRDARTGDFERFELIAPNDILVSSTEYARLMAALTGPLNGQPLKNAVEDDTRQDLTILARATGWDARLIALGALAHQRNATLTGSNPSYPAGAQLAPDALYALFRGGLPTELGLLAAVSPSVISSTLTKANEKTIVAVNVSTVQTTFLAFAREQLLREQPPTTVSDANALLAQVPWLAGERERFDQVYFQANPPQGDNFFAALAQTNPAPEPPAVPVSTATINFLKLQGQLAALTQNNAPLVASVQPSLSGQFRTLVAGVTLDGHKSIWWRNKLDSLVGGSWTLTNLVPRSYAGSDTQRRDVYADDLARRVRASLPTATIAKQLAQGELTRMLANGSADLILANQTATALFNAEAIGYVLGKTPLGRFIGDNAAVIWTAGNPDRTATEPELKALHRLYQVTPSDAALKLLYAEGFSSALEIAAVPKTKFVARFSGAQSLGVDVAGQVADRARQVAAMAYNVFTGVRQLESRTTIAGMSSTESEHAALNASVQQQYPTMQNLFGSLDYCECEHCKSLLSPAAYLMDCLSFLDVPSSDWKRFVEDWNARPENEDRELLATKNPYDVLAARRADLPHLELTCENAHVELPFIDVANEILEAAVQGVIPNETTTPNVRPEDNWDYVAEPRSVSSAAYGQLLTAKFPLKLPFDIEWETTGRFLKEFNVSRPELMEAFRTEASGSPASWTYVRSQAYDELGLSDADRLLFTTTPHDWKALYGVTDMPDAEAMVELKNAKRLARRLGVTYQELASLLNTSFINRRLDELMFLRKAGIGPRDAYHFANGTITPTSEEGVGISKRLQRLDARYSWTPSLPTELTASSMLSAAYSAGMFDDILVLVPGTDLCDFSQTTLGLASGSTIQDATYQAAFVRLNLLVRLWKKLDFELGDLDAALRALYPSTEWGTGTYQNLTGLDTALIHLAHLVTLGRRLKVTGLDRLKLLSFWGNLPTRGLTSVYDRLILGPSTLGQLFWDSPDGTYLPASVATSPVSNAPTVVSQMAQVVRALDWTADEVHAVLSVSGLFGGTAAPSVTLTLANISTLLRYRVLSQLLGLKTAEFVTWARMPSSELQPFRALPATTINATAADVPLASLRFVDSVERFRGAGLSGEAVRYLFDHSYDGGSAHEPFAKLSSSVVAEFYEALARIDEAYPDVAPAPATDADVERAIGLVLDADSTRRFMEAFTAVTGVTGVPQPSEALLVPADFATEYDVRVATEAAANTSTVTFLGALTTTRKAALTTAHPEPMFSRLLDQIEDQQLARGWSAFFDAKVKPVLPTLIYPTVFVLASTTAAEQARRSSAANAALSAYRRRAGRDAVAQRLSALVDSTASLVYALSEDSLRLALNTAPTTSLFDHFLRVGTSDVKLSWFDLTGAQVGSHAIAASLDAEPTLRPGGATRFRLEAYVRPNAAGIPKLLLTTSTDDCGAEVRVGDALEQRIEASGSPINATVPLADSPTNAPIRLTVDVWGLVLGSITTVSLVGADGVVMPMDTVPRWNPETTDAALAAIRLLHKAVLLARTLKLSDRDVLHILTNNTRFGDISLSLLPFTAEQTFTSPHLAWAGVARLVDYARLKALLSPGSDGLVNLLQAARQTFLPNVSISGAQTTVLADVQARLAALTLRPVPTVAEAFSALSFVATGSAVINVRTEGAVDEARDERGLWRVVNVLALSTRLGLSPLAARDLTSAQLPAGTARRLRDGLRARYTTADWHALAKGVFDDVRIKKRDALVAHQMAAKAYEVPEELFKDLLLDPMMQPVVLTSRLQLAIGSVQTFLQRALLNLEGEVPPSAIDAQQWEWMKRYRVWEANRKIFLFPENWLEPEFRDDKSPAFEELEATLLKDEITEDSAEAAFAAYLDRLSEVARLDVASMYWEQDPLKPQAGVLHVIARTQTQPHRYFYRTMSQRMWSPWKPVEVEVTTPSVTLAVFRRRVHIFWADLLPFDTTGGTVSTPADSLTTPMEEGPVRTKVSLNWTELQNGQWLPPKSVHFEEAAVDVLRSDIPATKMGLRLTVEPQTDGTLMLSFGSSDFRVRFAGRTRRPQYVDVRGAPTAPALEVTEARYSQWLGAGQLSVHYAETVRVETVDGQQVLKGTDASHPILGATAAGADGTLGDFTVVIPSNETKLAAPSVNALVAPFFFQDDRHTFFVEPDLSEKDEVKVEYLDRQQTDAAFPSVQHVWEETYPYEVPVGYQLDGLPAEGDLLESLIQPLPISDWLRMPGTLLRFGTTYIGLEGGVKLSLDAGAPAVRGLGGGRADVQQVSRNTFKLSTSGSLPRGLGLQSKTYIAVEEGGLAGGGLLSGPNGRFR